MTRPQGANYQSSAKGFVSIHFPTECRLKTVRSVVGDSDINHQSTSCMQQLNIWPQSLSQHSLVDGGFEYLSGQQPVEQARDVVVALCRKYKAFTTVVEHVVALLYLLATAPATFVSIAEPGVSAQLKDIQPCAVEELPVRLPKFRPAGEFLPPVRALARPARILHDEGEAEEGILISNLSGAKRGLLVLRQPPYLLNKGGGSGRPYKLMLI